MLVAQIQKDERIIANDHQKYNYILNNKDNLVCPICKKKVIFVDGIFVIKHFRHKAKNNCSFEPETKEHIEMKNTVCGLLNLNPLKHLEVNVGYAVPDIYLPKEKIAIEVQNSNLSYKKFIERTRRYTREGVHVLWIFHKNLLHEDVSKTLKKAHEIYFGRIYIYSNWKIYPVHLEPKTTTRTDINGLPYIWFYKRKRGTIYGEKVRGDIFKTKNNWKENNFLIARFYDKQFWKGGQK